MSTVLSSILITIILTLFWIVLRAIRVKNFTKQIKTEKRQTFKENYSQYFSDNEADNYQSEIGSRVMCIICFVIMIIRSKNAFLFPIFSLVLIIVMCIQLNKITTDTKKKIRQKFGVVNEDEFQQIFMLFKEEAAPDSIIDLFVTVICMLIEIIGMIFNVIYDVIVIFFGSKSNSNPETEYRRDLEEWRFEQFQKQQKEEERREFQRQRDEE